MSNQQDSSEPDAATGGESFSERMRLVLRRADQLVVAVVITICLVLLVVYVAEQRIARSRQLDIRRAPAKSAQYLVDLNSANWPELANLPGIGEHLARSIVTYRERHGPFVDIEQLCMIDGIGAKKLEGIRPFVTVAPEPLVARGRQRR